MSFSLLLIRQLLLPRLVLLRERTLIWRVLALHLLEGVALTQGVLNRLPSGLQTQLMQRKRARSLRFRCNSPR